MKKILMIMALAIATVGAVSAQIGFKVDANVSFSNFYGKGAGANMIIGYRAGVAAEIPFAGELSTAQFFFSPGLVFQSKGATGKGKVDYQGSTEIIDMTIRSHYVKLPLLVGARSQFANKMGVSFQVGPYIACGLSSRATGRTSVQSVDVSASQDLYKEDPMTGKVPMRRFDVGTTLSTALEYSQFYFQIGTDLGLIEIVTNGTAKNINVFAGLGYRF